MSGQVQRSSAVPGDSVANLFVSYKSEDRPRVKPLVDALQADGVSLWWDAHIQGGQGWRQAIHTELEAANCVLVVWSKRSVGPEGEFVQDEATRAKRRGVYLPVLIDKVDPPLGFGETQALLLTGWTGDRADVRYQALLASVQAAVAGSRVVRTDAVVPVGPSLHRRAVLGGGVVLGAVALGGAGWWLLKGRSANARSSIAVLPFANLSGDPEKAYFSDGMAEELRSALARIAGLKVAARTSSEKMRDADVKEAAAKLGVTHVLTGSVRQGDGKIRVTAQLANGEDGLEIWSESFDRPAGDALAVQGSIAESVANALSLSIGKAATMLGGTKDPAAYEAYLRGIARAVTGDDAIRSALADFDRAIAIDPNFAAAHANRAFELLNLVKAGPDQAESKELIQAGEAAANRAVALEPSLPIAHAAVAYSRGIRLDKAGAWKAYDKAVALPGAGSRELAAAGGFFVLMGQIDKGIALLDRAIELDPLNGNRRLRKIDPLVWGRRYPEALAAIASARADGFNSPALNESEAWLLLFKGDYPGAERTFAKSGAAQARALAFRAVLEARRGGSAASDKAFVAFKEGGATPYQLAVVHAQRGEIDLAFAQLDRAVATRDPGLGGLFSDPLLDPLRGDARFAVLGKLADRPPA